MEPIECNSKIAITGAREVTSREKLDQQLGSKPLHKRRGYRKLSDFLKIFTF